MIITVCNHCLELLLHAVFHGNGQFVMVFIPGSSQNPYIAENELGSLADIQGELYISINIYFVFLS